MEDQYPKILIFSQSFNTLSGGGITLTSLFSSWPKENVAVLSYPFMLAHISDDHCATYYQIGTEELHWIFPFSLFKKKSKSGLVQRTPVKPPSHQAKGNSVRNIFSYGLLQPFLEWIGLVHLLSGISISRRLNEWLKEYSPDIIYFQISNRESIKFALDLVCHLKIPSVIHMMDDWPSTISGRGIFKSYWQKKIDGEFRQLLSKIDLHLSICEDMSSEYQKRYGYNFISFHNTLDLTRWNLFTRKDLALNAGTKIILFSGRIGKGIERSLFELAAAVDILRREGVPVSLHIQSPRNEHAILDKLRTYESVKVNPPIAYDKIPELYSKADILVLANDFSQEGIRFLKYSMPTKAPEYMISGTPVLVYASAETALYRLFHENECGHCVTMQSSQVLANAFKLLLEDLSYRSTLSRNAVAYATEHFDSRRVRPLFHNLLIKTAEKLGLQ